ncbi:hypothetical protein [Melghirimyces algeriensis]|uniref:Uncharacterized protein n=1 Tax=Melghirimyces algeriensis TaxID=910412 RepID=A0A521CTU1_9BACL|nr:hypothetical protein [Melghirimyces algeriensis]SMO62866.1 hypothetical protein SAMN06264849_104179 [Melghirimyces algeriensis]
MRRTEKEQTLHAQMIVYGAADPLDHGNPIHEWMSESLTQGRFAYQHAHSCIITDKWVRYD